MFTELLVDLCTIWMLLKIWWPRWKWIVNWWIKWRWTLKMIWMNLWMLKNVMYSAWSKERRRKFDMILKSLSQLWILKSWSIKNDYEYDSNFYLYIYLWSSIKKVGFTRVKLGYYNVKLRITCKSKLIQSLVHNNILLHIRIQNFEI